MIHILSTTPTRHMHQGICGAEIKAVFMRDVPTHRSALALLCPDCRSAFDLVNIRREEKRALRFMLPRDAG